MIEFLIGEESFLRDQYIYNLINNDKLEFSDVNCTKYDNFSEREYELYYQVPLVADKRIMIVYTDELSKNKLVSNILSNPCDSTDIYFIPSNMDKRTSFYKSIQKNKQVKEFRKISIPELQKFIQDILNKEKCKISKETFELLVNRINYDNRPECTLYTVETMVRQVIFNNPKEVTIESLEIIDKCNDENSFALAKHLLNAESRELFELVDNLLAEKEDPIALLSLLLYNFRLSYKLSLIDSKDATQELGITPYQLKSIKKLSASKSSKCMSLIQDNVNLIKNGENGALIMKLTISKLIVLLQEKF